MKLRLGPTPRAAGSAPGTFPFNRRQGPRRSVEETAASTAEAVLDEVRVSDLVAFGLQCLHDGTISSRGQ